MITFEDRDEIEPRLRLPRAQHEMVIALREKFNFNAGEIADALNGADTPVTIRIQQVAAIIYGNVD